MGKKNRHNRRKKAGETAQEPAAASAVQQGFGSVSKLDAPTREISDTSKETKKLSSDSQDRLTYAMLALAGLLVLAVIVLYTVPFALQQLGMAMSSNSSAAPNVRLILTENEAQTRNVFQSGFPHVVLCQNGTIPPELPATGSAGTSPGTTPKAKGKPSKARASVAARRLDRLSRAAGKLEAAGFTVATMDCDGTLPGSSGQQTVYDRLRVLARGTAPGPSDPWVFVAAHGKRPVLLPPSAFKSPGALVQAAGPLGRTRPMYIKSSKDLGRCLSHAQCLVLGSPYRRSKEDRDELQAFLEDHPSTKVALLDTKQAAMVLRPAPPALRAAMPGPRSVPTRAKVAAGSAETFALLLKRAPAALGNKLGNTEEAPGKEGEAKSQDESESKGKGKGKGKDRSGQPLVATAFTASGPMEASQLEQVLEAAAGDEAALGTAPDRVPQSLSQDQEGGGDEEKEEEEGEQRDSSRASPLVAAPVAQHGALLHPAREQEGGEGEGGGADVLAPVTGLLRRGSLKLHRVRVKAPGAGAASGREGRGAGGGDGTGGPGASWDRERVAAERARRRVEREAAGESASAEVGSDGAAEPALTEEQRAALEARVRDQMEAEAMASYPQAADPEEDDSAGEEMEQDEEEDAEEVELLDDYGEGDMM